MHDGLLRHSAIYLAVDKAGAVEVSRPTGAKHCKAEFGALACGSQSRVRRAIS